MNFEIKSTFIQAICSPPSTNGIRLLVLNTLSLGLVAILYLTNHLLPAVIAARPHGTLLLFIFAGSIAVKALCISLTTARMAIQFKNSITRNFSKRHESNQPYGYPFLDILKPLATQELYQSPESPKE